MVELRLPWAAERCPKTGEFSSDRDCHQMCEYQRVVLRHPRLNRALAVNWALALVLPAVGCAFNWLWIATTITAHDCQTGSRGSTEASLCLPHWSF